MLWRLWSPSWGRADAAFPHTAVAFDNDDFVDVVIHSYRHRFGAVAGDPVYASIEGRLARVGGRAIIRSVIGEGTEIELTMPRGA